jgi:hypothetical protein
LPTMGVSRSLAKRRPSVSQRNSVLAYLLDGMNYSAAVA